jgi:hypothetical protein
MLRTLFAIALMLMLASPAIAQDDDDLLAGFKLGKFHATAKLLAADLIYIDALTNEMNIAEITDENYQSGVITDDDILNAQLVLAYSIWRIQFIIQPACESGLEDDSFDHLALEEFREPTQAILTELLRLSDEMLDGSDFSYLVGFTDAIAEGGYVEDLILMAEEAALMAGEELEE